MLIFDTITGEQVDSAGQRQTAPPKISYESAPTWAIQFVEADPAAGTVSPIDVSDAVAWRAALDKDWDHTTEPMCRTLDADIDASDAANGIISVPLDAFTETFLDALDGKGRLRDCPFELAGYDYEGRKTYSAIFLVEATGAVDPAGGEPPDPPGNYYTKTEADALLAAKGDHAVTANAAETIHGHRAVRILADGVHHASSADPSHAPGVTGIAANSATIGAAVTVRILGPLTEPSWSWTAGQPIYVGVDGVLTQTPPSAGYIREIALAVSPTKVIVRPMMPITLAA